VLCDHVESGTQLVKKHHVGLDAVDRIQALVSQRDQYHGGGTRTRRQHGAEDGGSDRIPPACHLEGELGRELAHTRRAGALPLWHTRRRVKPVMPGVSRQRLRYRDPPALWPLPRESILLVAYE
jgi:hypothetical protein